MSQIRKGFIANNAIDGTKLKLLNNEAVRAANADGTDAELMKLDSSNVLQFMKLPQVSVDPSVANDVARKGYVDATVDTAKGEVQSAVDAEQAAREAADADLQGQIDTEKGRIDAILSASDADKDSFAEIVQLINSVDTENDSAFAGYVLSNDAALAQEVSDRQSGDSALQSNIDAEASSREAADAAEQSAREAADAALQAAIDALTADDLTDVSTASKADGDLFQWDSSEGKWKNVAPLSAASVVSIPGGETLQVGFSETNNYNDGTGPALGTTFRPASNMTVSKVGLKFARTSNLSSTVTAKIYSVSQNTYDINGTSFSSVESDFTLVATSTNSLSPSDLALYPTAAEMEYFTFNNVELVQDGYYVIWAEVDGASLATDGTNYLAPAYSNGSMGQFSAGHYKQIAPGGLYGGASDLQLGYEIYTVGEGSGTVAEVGVIKTNVNGLLDDSFIDVTIARSAELASEIAARQDADNTLQGSIDAEVADREAGDASLQAQIDALDSGSSAGLAQEISDRQAADATLQSNIDAEKARIDAILSASTADKDSFAEIVNLINSVDTENDTAFASYVLSNDAALAQEVSDRIAGDDAQAAALSAESSARAAEMAQEVSDRQAADTALAADISDEATRAQAAEDALDAKIDQEIFDRAAAVSAEQSAREAADADLQDQLDSLSGSSSAALAQEVADRQAADAAEASAREAADGIFESRIGALESVTHRKEKFTLTATDITNGYVDLLVTHVSDSEMVFVGALYLHSGDHYMVSTQGSVTRLTWVNDVAVGGTSELVEGDVVYVRYMSSATPGGEGGGGGDGGGGGEEPPPFDPNDLDGNGIPDDEEGGGDEPPLNPDM